MVDHGHRQTSAGPSENASGTKNCLTVEEENFSGSALVGEESTEQKEAWSEALIKTERLEEEWGGEGEKADEPTAVEWGSSLNQDTSTEAQSTSAEDSKQLGQVETIVIHGDGDNDDGSDFSHPAEALTVRGECETFPDSPLSDSVPLSTETGLSGSVPFREEAGFQLICPEEGESGTVTPHQGLCRDNHGNATTQGEYGVNTGTMQDVLQLVKPCSVRVECLMLQDSHQCQASSGKSPHPALSETRSEMLRVKERPLSCTYCGKRFIRNVSLKMHLQGHTGDKLLSCTQSRRKFSSRHNLTAHQSRQNREKRFSCETCGKAFFLKHHLSSHQRVHTGERPYRCAHCGNCYKQLNNLIHHQRSHTGERPYGCMECGKCFGRLDNLKVHQKIHTREA
ncbi:RB-associated KRAB zinc finger protein-like [Megalops cyprinoides]|uniref:RB-associated KRAB zinc finger protein-like n=1 Tax=Megalops cyprinoides TaxID=118141 RepID=UPI0018653330|nr:RB-associated KRAB zinc finger protein-like [Megalops cyprinoides]